MAKWTAEGYISYLAKRHNKNQSQAIKMAREKGYKISNDRARQAYNIAKDKPVSIKTRSYYYEKTKKLNNSLGYRLKQENRYQYVFAVYFKHKDGSNKMIHVTYKTDEKITSTKHENEVKEEVKRIVSEGNYEVEKITSIATEGYYEQTPLEMLE